MKKVLLAVILLIAISVPVAAAYQFNWTTGFENPQVWTDKPLAPLPVRTLGQNGWFNADNPSYADEVPMDVVAGAGLAGSQAVVMRGNTGSLHNAVAKDMSAYAGGTNYYRGYAKFWVYDPGFLNVSGVDARVGVYGNMGENNMGYMATAQIQDASTRDPNYWWAQWSFSAIKMDGVGTATGVGYSFVPGLPAPRVWGAWSYVLLTWNFSYAIPKNPDSGLYPAGGSTGVIKYYINQSSVSPNLTLNIDSTSSRWNNFRSVKGLFMGTGMTTVHNYIPLGAAKFDNVEFHGDPMPEPSSLLALGTGLLGMVGLIRRRK